jgi:small-conductance mechanosensitive channel
VTRNLIETGVVIVAGVLLSYGLSWLLTQQAGDEYARHYVRRAVHFIVFLCGIVALGFVWEVYGDRAGLGIGFFAAGLAFALQEVIGAVAGWFNILLGGIYRIDDRIEIAGVRGDVIDITPLRTKLLETGVSDPPPTGQPASTDLWIHGRQPTGRMVVVSNKATFDQPVFNYSTMWEFVWQELKFPVAHDEDWHLAESIIADEAERVSATEEAHRAMEEMQNRYPVPRSELEPRVYATATDNYMELAARFVVPVRQARLTTNELTRRVKERLDEVGIPIASSTSEVTVFSGDGRTSRESSRTG